MPRRLEEALKRSARKKGIEEGSERWGAYVYGTQEKMAKEGEIPKSEAPGAKHDD